MPDALKTYILTEMQLGSDWLVNGAVKQYIQACIMMDVIWLFALGIAIAICVYFAIKLYKRYKGRNDLYSDDDIKLFIVCVVMIGTLLAFICFATNIMGWIVYPDAMILHEFIR